MRKIREVLRLRFVAQLSYRQIGQSLNLSRSVVANYVIAALKAGVTWPLPDDLDDDGLVALLANQPRGQSAIAEPDFAVIHQELKRRGVTRTLLWEEYCEANPNNAYGYSQFRARYQAFRDQLKTSMRQTHFAGEKMFVDFAGMTVDVWDSSTGALRPASIFVAVLGASHYTYCEAVWTQSLPDWIAAHTRAFAYFQGVARLIVPDYVPGNIIVVLCPSSLCAASSSTADRWKLGLR